MDRVHCALVSRELGEALAGTAARATGWVAVEHPGPWTPRAPGRAELGDVAHHLDVPDVRVQLVRPVRHQHEPLPRPQGHTVLLGHGAPDPALRWLERLHVDRLEQLLELDPAVTTAPQPPGLGAPVDHDVWLVCTHARRDACCAVHGRPAALALADAGVDVWETTHTGGHRFAATALVLPDGLSLGRLDTVDVVATAAALADGHLPAGLLRGRCAVPRPAQAAEVALREQLGTDGRDAVHHLDQVDRGDGETRVTLRAAGETWWVHVTTHPAAEARPVSDDAEPTTPDEHVVGRIVRADAG